MSIRDSKAKTPKPILYVINELWVEPDSGEIAEYSYYAYERKIAELKSEEFKKSYPDSRFFISLAPGRTVKERLLANE